MQQHIIYTLMMGGKEGGGGSIQLIFIIAMIVIFWLFMIRPQARKAKMQKQFSQNLKEGNKIVTLSGIHGTIKKINEDNSISLEISPGTNIKIEKSAISLELSKIYSSNNTIASNKK